MSFMVHDAGRALTNTHATCEQISSQRLSNGRKWLIMHVRLLNNSINFISLGFLCFILDMLSCDFKIDKLQFCMCF